MFEREREREKESKRERKREKFVEKVYVCARSRGVVTSKKKKKREREQDVLYVTYNFNISDPRLRFSIFREGRRSCPFEKNVRDLILFVHKWSPQGARIFFGDR